MGGSSGSDTTTSVPWSGQSPYLSDVFRQAQGQYYAGGPQYYPDSTVVGFSPQSQLAMDLQTNRALNGSGAEQGFNQYLQNAMGQNQLNLDPSAYAGQQAMAGMGQGQDYMNLAGQNPFLNPGQAQQFASSGSGPYASALQGMTGYSGFGEAQNAFGSPASGSLGASNQYVQDTLSQGPTSLNNAFDAVQGRLGSMGGAGQEQLNATARGDYLNSNPYLDQTFGAAAEGLTEQFNDSVLPGIAAQFGASGRTGSGTHALATGRAAEGLTDSLKGMAADIYGNNYQQERGRQLNAAGELGQLGLGARSQDLQGLGLGADIYNSDNQRQLGAAGLGGSLYSAQNSAELGRLGLGSSLYLGERGLGQQAALGGLQNSLGQNQLAGNMFNQGMGNLTTAGNSLMGNAQQGMSNYNDLYGMMDQSRFRAGTLTPQASQLDYQNIGMLGQVGQQVEGQAQNYLNDAVNRWNYNQNLPQQQLSMYSNLINQLPGGFGTVTGPSQQGSGFAGAAGGALSGAAIGSQFLPGWGTGIGAGIGGLLGLFG